MTFFAAFEVDPTHPLYLFLARPAPPHPISSPPNASERSCHSPQAASGEARASYRTASHASGHHSGPSGKREPHYERDR
ncbi:hypothetical protein MKEN_00538300 [Mycena kentingensis (nom. inval.)]|nr:hypothetical protein MKEN_00538300 [Mycena kentingensis (nom. inval.)]